MTIWYMRDNHTLRSLPHNVNAAMELLREEFRDGETYGMLCTKTGPMARENVHAGSSWLGFAPRARKWLTQALAPTDGDMEYESWMATLQDTQPISAAPAPTKD